MRTALAAAFLAFLLTACATLEPAVVGRSAEFELAGRIAVRYGPEAFTGNIAWRHGAEDDEMLITSSLGAGIARLVRNGNEFVLTTAEPKAHFETVLECGCRTHPQPVTQPVTIAVGRPMLVTIDVNAVETPPKVTV